MHAGCAHDENCQAHPLRSIGQAVNQLWVQEKVRNGDLAITRVKGLDNLADALTKNEVLELGCPFGIDLFVQGFYTEGLGKDAKLLKILPKFPFLQASWFLLYFCAVPRINHLLRIMPPEQVRKMAPLTI